MGAFAMQYREWTIESIFHIIRVHVLADAGACTGKLHCDEFESWPGAPDCALQTVHVTFMIRALAFFPERLKHVHVHVQAGMNLLSRFCIAVFAMQNLNCGVRPPFLFSLFNVRARVPFCLRPEKKNKKVVVPIICEVVNT